MTFKFSSVEHFIATGLAKVKSDAEAVAKYVDAHLASIDSDVDKAAAIVGAVDPALAAAALAAARAGEAALAAVAAAIDKAGSAVAANGLNVALDGATVSAFQEALTSIKAVVPTLTTPPAGSVAK